MIARPIGTGASLQPIDFSFMFFSSPKSGTIRFSPINQAHRHLREAKLSFSSVGKWDKSPLKLRRVDSDHNQVLRGTVQHEVFSGNKQVSAYLEDGYIQLQVLCKADATENLDTEIPYGLAVTLEIEAGSHIPIYDQIRTTIRTRVAP